MGRLQSPGTCRKCGKPGHHDRTCKEPDSGFQIYEAHQAEWKAIDEIAALLISGVLRHRWCAALVAALSRAQHGDEAHRDLAALDRAEREQFKKLLEAMN
jgi:hypothetical protein